MGNNLNAHRIACEFCNDLASAIGAELLPIIASKNATPEYAGACASHDFCDANESMGRAFSRIMARAYDLDSRADSDLWNRAWNIARENAFDVDAIAKAWGRIKTEGRA